MKQSASPDGGMRVARRGSNIENRHPLMAYLDV